MNDHANAQASISVMAIRRVYNGMMRYIFSKSLTSFISLFYFSKALVFAASLAILDIVYDGMFLSKFSAMDDRRPFFAQLLIMLGSGLGTSKQHNC